MKRYTLEVLVRVQKDCENPYIWTCKQILNLDFQNVGDLIDNLHIVFHDVPGQI